MVDCGQVQHITAQPRKLPSCTAWWQREVLARAVARMDEWTRLHAHRVEALLEEWHLLMSTRKRRAAECGYLSLATSLKRRRETHDGGPCALSLTADLDGGEP